MRRSWWLAALTVMALSSGAWAQDANAAIAADDCTIPSMRGKATIEISGQMDLAVWVNNVDVIDLNSANFRKTSVNNTEFGPDTADLTFKVKAAENAYLTVTLDMMDAWNSNDGLEQDDFLKEMYFTFDNIANTGFGVKVGKMAVPFAYDKDELLLSPYLDGAGNSLFNRKFNGNWSADDYAYRYTTGFFDARSSYIDNTFGITPYYNWCDKLLVEASLFQNNNDRGVNARNRRSNDDMLFRSMAFKVTYTPIENLILQASGVVLYDDRGDRPGDSRFTDRSYGLSLSADYTFQLANRDFNIFAEYQHGWNTWDPMANETRLFDVMSAYAGLPFGVQNGYWDDSSSSDIHFGASYKITDRVKLFGQGEYLCQKQSGISAGRARDWSMEQDAWRAIAAIQYEMTSGIVLEGGYQHEWLTTRVNQAGVGTLKRNLDADSIYAGVRYSF